MIIYQDEAISRIAKICEDVPFRQAKEIYDLLNTGKQIKSDLLPQGSPVAEPSKALDKKAEKKAAKK